MSARAQVHLAGRFRRHLGRVENKQLPAILIADPKFLLIRAQRGAMGAMRDRFGAGEHQVRNSASAQVHHVKPNVFAETDVGVAIAAVHGEWENAAFADPADIPDERIVLRAENPKIGFGAEIDKLAVETGDARYRIKGRNAILVDREYFAMMEDWVVARELVIWKDQIEQGLREAKAGRGRDLREVLQEIGLEHIYDEARGRAASSATAS